jgi:hypothetical protein
MMHPVGAERSDGDGCGDWLIGPPTEAGTDDKILGIGVNMFSQ